ncbi:ATPase family protein associated with various cellular activities (AAA) [Lutibacter oceani]|uniref:ATPase family protein associated with various cellular activities (AAA) n=1 Tax=Lutibacter oceani TaxID=1853311 RepID=A0A3D9RS04_9FLAO|nr:AAA family ATPase [Lutibacter oceani]REE78831.1 ATPase family protein associated with various cellular activities (AAA) [Lutibacter oceani]
MGNNNKYWAVGSSHDGEDVTNFFLKNNVWYDGYAEHGDFKYVNTLKEINIGDILVMKSSSTKGPKHSITFTKVKGIGKIINKIADHKFEMLWYKNEEFPKDFDYVSYRKTIEPLRNDNINKYVNSLMSELNNEELIKVLKYKKQIILQGPPGTGKTYTAKSVAKEMTDFETVSNPTQLLNDFYKNFNPTDKEVLKDRQERSELRARFLSKFPKDEIKNLSLENYCIGTGERDNFCWWIELGLKPLGYYFPGSARSYRIYWSKKNETYSKNGSLKELNDAEAMKVVAKFLDKVIVEKDYKSGEEFFGPSFILKLLNTYYPDEYVPVNAINYMKNALSLFSIKTENLDFIDLNKTLMSFHQQKNKEFNTEVEPHEFMRFLVDNFNLKEGEKINENQVVAKGAYELVQFHPAYSYEDFVRGIEAEVIDGTPTFSVKNKTLIEFAERAIDNPKANFVLIIDEINRANLPAVLGELIYALEYRDKPVNSLYELEGERSIKLPNNLFIIGTMNTADRSVGHIDYAIRRRFSFVDVLPNEMHVPDFAKEKFQSVSDLFSKDFLASDFKKQDVQIGHSYFMADNKEELEIKIKFEVVPILKEYVKDGVLNEKATEEINKL